MPQSFVLSFKKDISVVEESSDRIIIQSRRIKGNLPQSTFNIESVSPGFGAGLDRAEGLSPGDSSSP